MVPELQALHARFESVLPRIVRHARVMFRNVKCYHTKEDKIQEVRGYCWKWVRQLHKARQEWWHFVSSSRRLRLSSGPERPQDRRHDRQGCHERDRPAAARLLRRQAPGLQHREHQPAGRGPHRQHGLARCPIRSRSAWTSRPGGAATTSAASGSWTRLALGHRTQGRRPPVPGQRGPRLPDASRVSDDWQNFTGEDATCEGRPVKRKEKGRRKPWSQTTATAC